MRTSREPGFLLSGTHSDTVTGGDELTLLDELEIELQAKLELIEMEDHSGLVDYLERVVDRRPEDAYAAKDLGEAYVMNGEADKALELLAPLHRRHPHFEDVQWVILDALFSSGRDEKSFEWTAEPPVVRLNEDAIHLCHDFSRGREVCCEVADLYSELLCEGYCAFTEDELLDALRRDDRFVVQDGTIELVVSGGDDR